MKEKLRLSDWSAFENAVILFFAVLGFGGGTWLVLARPDAPPALAALFLGTGVSSLVYRFLGGIPKETSGVILGFKVGGTLGALMITTWLINSTLHEQSAQRMRFTHNDLAGRWTWQYAPENLIGTLYFKAKEDRLTFTGVMQKKGNGEDRVQFRIADGIARIVNGDRLEMAFTAKEPGPSGRTYRLESVQPLRNQNSFTGKLVVPVTDPLHASLDTFAWGVGMQQER